MQTCQVVLRERAMIRLALKQASSNGGFSRLWNPAKEISSEPQPHRGTRRLYRGIMVVLTMLVLWSVQARAETNLIEGTLLPKRFKIRAMR